MGWCPEYQKELDELMKEWQSKIKERNKDFDPMRVQLVAGKGKIVNLNDEYKERIAEIKSKYGM